MSEGSFGGVIEAHLELQRRNRRLERTMPIERYRGVVEQALVSREPRTRSGDVAVDAVVGAAPWDDPDSWWNVHEPPAHGFDWGS
jgi:hypothetical protein